MTFGDYAALIETETSFGKPAEHGRPQSFVESYMQGITGLHTSAVRGAPTHAGSFPVVVYAPSLNAPSTENIELCEYLASNGFCRPCQPKYGRVLPNHDG